MRRRIGAAEKNFGKTEQNPLPVVKDGKRVFASAGFLLVTGDKIQYNIIIQTVMTGEGE